MARFPRRDPTDATTALGEETTTTDQSEGRGSGSTTKTLRDMVKGQDLQMDSPLITLHMPWLKFKCPVPN